MFCKKCKMPYKPLEISYTKETVVAEYVCPSCWHRVIIDGEKDVVKTFWN